MFSATERNSRTSKARNSLLGRGLFISFHFKRPCQCARRNVPFFASIFQQVFFVFSKIFSDCSWSKVGFVIKSISGVASGFYWKFPSVTDHVHKQAPCITGITSTLVNVLNQTDLVWDELIRTKESSDSTCYRNKSKPADRSSCARIHLHTHLQSCTVYSSLSSNSLHGFSTTLKINANGWCVELQFIKNMNGVLKSEWRQSSRKRPSY